MDPKDVLSWIGSYMYKALPMPYVIKMTHQQVIFPFYHLVSDQNPVHIKHLYQPKSTRSFMKDLEFLLKYFEPMDMEDVMTFVKNGKKRKKSGFFLTFDDGLREFYEVVSPVLLKKGIPAACFVNTGFVDNKAMFYRYKVSILADKLLSNPSEAGVIYEAFKENQIIQTDIIKFLMSATYNDTAIIDRLAGIMACDFHEYLKNNRPYMTHHEINDLIAKGFYIGAHSIDHPLYADIVPEEQIRQTQMSVDWVTKQWNQKYSIFAFPFTDEGVQSSFYTSLQDIDLVFGTAGLKNDPISNVIQRIPMEHKNDSAAIVIKKQYGNYILKALMDKNTRRRDDQD